MPTRLQDIKYETDYRTGYHDIVGQFFRPSLECATAYWRAVGYFSSSALESFGQPLGTFLQNGGSIRLITSVELSQRDLDAIESGMRKRDICERRIDEIIENEFAEGIGSGTARLARLLELDKLTILVAVPKEGTGIYHEKIGLFFQGIHYVAFSGSINESRNAFENNRECIDVFLSWVRDGRAARKKEHFEALWDGNDNGVDVYSFPEAAKKKLIKVCNEWNAVGAKVGPGEVKKPNKWRHQDEAVAKFLEAERGILNMATGTGKTRTALKIIQHLFDMEEINRVIVSTSGTDLLDQWHSEVLPIRDSVNTILYRHYKNNYDIDDFMLSTTRAVLIVSRLSLAKVLKQVSNEVGRRTLLIHDEVHGLGSPKTREQLTGLSNAIRFRLGLSATPEREYDEAGNSFILEHIGPEIFRFDLEQAIRRGILASFNYHPLPYEISESDRRRIRSVYSSASSSTVNGMPLSDQEVWTRVARVYKTSKAKLPVFQEFIRDNKDLLKRCIIFVETRDYGEEVIDLIHSYRRDFHTYFSGEDSETLRRFARGELECLITCHRVSEGIDIQSLSSVILFSSARSSLETVQRMGRCLRTDPSNLSKVANVVDFIRQPSKNVEKNADEERRDWLKCLSRVRSESN